MSDAPDKGKELHLEAGRGVGKPLPPRTIAAQSQAGNSITKIWILGSLALALLILGAIALFVHPEMARDMVWASVSLAAYLAGSGEFSRKEEK